MIADDWILTVAPAWKGTFRQPAETLARLRDAATLIHENDRGTTSLFSVEDVRLVAKRSKRQERLLWIRVISLALGGEGARAFRNMSRLRHAGLPVPEPVLTLERVRLGFVLESWHVYRHVEGEPCTCADAARAARALEAVHACGWVHRDPHVGNFLKDGERTHIIDWAKARHWPFAYARRYDVVLLDKCCPGARLMYAGWRDEDLWSRLARLHNGWMVRWRAIKRGVRGHGTRWRSG